MRTTMRQLRFFALLLPFAALLGLAAAVSGPAEAVPPPPCSSTCDNFYRICLRGNTVEFCEQLRQDCLDSCVDPFPFPGTP